MLFLSVFVAMLELFILLLLFEFCFTLLCLLLFVLFIDLLYYFDDFILLLIQVAIIKISLSTLKQFDLYGFNDFMNAAHFSYLSVILIIKSKIVYKVLHIQIKCSAIINLLFCHQTICQSIFCHQGKSFYHLHAACHFSILLHMLYHHGTCKFQDLIFFPYYILLRSICHHSMYKLLLYEVFPHSSYLHMYINAFSKCHGHEIIHFSTIHHTFFHHPTPQCHFHLSFCFQNNLDICISQLQFQFHIHFAYHLQTALNKLFSYPLMCKSLCHGFFHFQMSLHIALHLLEQILLDLAGHHFPNCLNRLTHPKMFVGPTHAFSHFVIALHILFHSKTQMKCIHLVFCFVRLNPIMIIVYFSIVTIFYFELNLHLLLVMGYLNECIMQTFRRQLKLLCKLTHILPFNYCYQLLTYYLLIIFQYTNLSNCDLILFFLIVMFVMNRILQRQIIWRYNNYYIIVPSDFQFDIIIRFIKMEASFQITEDSRSLDQFFKSNKLEIKKEKKQMKQMERQRQRKNSTQLSLFGWLVKSRPKQNCQITQVPKNLIVNIYSYLRLSQIVKISQTCFYLYDCSKSIWCDSDFFKELQTDKLSTNELKNIFQKGGKMSHIKQLKSIYLGKNLKSCRQKIKIKVQQNNNHTLKPLAGNLLQVFQVSTKVHKSSAFLMDSHLQQIINSSFRSLISIKLQACRYIRKFYDISKCTQIISLSITQNSYLTNQDMRVIVKCCNKIQNLDLSGCDNLDQGIFKHLSKLINLQKLAMNNYQQPFGDLQCLKVLTNLKQVSLQNSCILDTQGIQLVKQLDSLQQLNINGCQLLTDFFVEGIMAIAKHHRVTLSMAKTKFSQNILKDWESYNNNNLMKQTNENN